MAKRKKLTAIDSLQFLIQKDRISTSANDKIDTILSQAQEKNQMVGVIGEEGIGKSTAAAVYTLSNKNVYYVRVGQSYQSKTLIHELIFLMTNKEVHQSTSMNRSIEYLSLLLTESSTRNLVIVDDAGKLKATGLGLFHELRDNTRGYAGFAFLGLQYFLDNLIRWSKEGKIGIAEFKRRFDFWFSLPYLTEQEKVAYTKTREITHNEDIHKILKEVTTIWELENRLNIHLARKSRKS